jgi:hypothetical protein
MREAAAVVLMQIGASAVEPLVQVFSDVDET